MSTVNTFLNCCPESVAVTVNQTTVNIDGSATLSYHDYKTYANVVDTGGVYTIQLDHDPLSDDAVSMALNSAVQGEAAAGSQHNYSVSGDMVTLHFTPAATDVFHFWYIGAITSPGGGIDDV